MARNNHPEETVEKILDVSTKLFLEKGYDNTSIQDIINNLGGLSKGAIYHHFKSKEDIFNAVGEKFSRQLIIEMQAVRDKTTLTGLEKLKEMFRLSLSGLDRDIVYSVAPNYIENPRLLAASFQEILSDTAPGYIQPVLEEGIRDGSIKTAYPKELAEVILIVTNLWMNPLVVRSTPQEAEKKARFFDFMLKSLGLNLFDEQMIAAYVRFSGLNENSLQ